MKYQFVSKSLRAESLTIVEKANEICENYARQGYDLSLRQLYYQFVSKDLLANTEQNYKRLGSIISDARLAGLIDWDMIKDRGRECVENNHWDSPADIIDACASQFRVDTWADQPNYVCVMVEKQALEGVLQPVCQTLDIPFMANKGYSSSSALYEMGRTLHAAFYGKGDILDYNVDGSLLNEDFDDQYFTEDANHANFYESMDTVQSAWNVDDFELAQRSAIEVLRPYMKPHPKDGRSIYVIYLGDHDPSGIDMTRDVQDRLSLFAECPVEVRRVALNMDQVRMYNPPENPAKMTDSRATDYVRKFGNSSWELDALEPSVLAALVRDMVVSLRDDVLWNAQRERQQAWRDEIKTLATTFRSTP